MSKKKPSQKEDENEKEEMSDEEFQKFLKEEIFVGTREESFAKAIGEMSKGDKIDFFTQIFGNEDDKYALLYVIADRYELSWLHQWLNKKLRLRTSLHGWRATQFERMITEGRKAQKGNIFSRFFGRKDKSEEVRKE